MKPALKYSGWRPLDERHDDDHHYAVLAQGCHEFMLAILGQTTCDTGQEITWEQAMKSELNFAPPRYGWDVEPPVKPGPNGQYPSAMPGITAFR